jgi:hypothetical protein
MKKYNLTIDKIPGFGFLIAYSEIDGLIIMIPFRTIRIMKHKTV